MIYEIQISNIPHELSNKEFRNSLLEFLGIPDSNLVHYQQKDNKKVLLLRMRDKKTYEELLRSKIINFKNLELEVEGYTREITQEINTLLELRTKLRNQGKLKKEHHIAKVYLSSIPYNTTEAYLFDFMSRYGLVKNTEIVRKITEGENEDLPQSASRGKNVKCRFAVIHYYEFEDAVEAFYADKVQIGKKKVKVKLFIPKLKPTERKEEISKKKIQNSLWKNISVFSPKKASPILTAERSMVTNEMNYLSRYVTKSNRTKGVKRNKKFQFKQNMKIPDVGENHDDDNLRINYGKWSHPLHSSFSFENRHDF